MHRLTALLPCVTAFLMFTACAEGQSSDQPSEWIIGSWVIDAAAQREETANVSPTELEDFDDLFRTNLLPIRETFHRDNRYEITNTLGGPFDDRWELVSQSEDSVTVRSAGYSWVARAAKIASTTPTRLPSELTYTFTDQDHMYVTIVMPVFGEEKAISYFFVRGE